jgi:hypothetical protein
MIKRGEKVLVASEQSVKYYVELSVATDRSHRIRITCEGPGRTPDAIELPVHVLSEIHDRVHQEHIRRNLEEE